MKNNADGSNLKLLIKTYLNDALNYFDIFGCFFFLFGAISRLLSYYFDDEDLFVAARIILCVDLIIWFMRILNVALVFQSLGPKLVMIQRMVNEKLNSILFSFFKISS